MNMSKDYKLYTEYKSISELKKLKFIINNVAEYKGKNQAYNVNILEIGCGKGNISLPLASLGYHIHGIDLNPNEISYVTKKNQFPNASFETSDAEKIEFEDQWNIVICSEIFEHLSSPENLAKRLKKIVKTDGIIIITIPNGYGPFELFFETPLRLPNRLVKNLLGRVDYGHKQNFSFQNFSRLLNKYNIYIDKVGHSDFISFLPMIRRINFLVNIDCKIADFLPYYLVSGWYFVCKFK